MNVELDSDEMVDRLMADDCADWSRAGARALVAWLLEIEGAGGTPQTFDLVGLRSDFSEYVNVFYLAADDEELSDVMSAAGLEWLRQNRTVIEVGDSARGHVRLIVHSW